MFPYLFFLFKLLLVKAREGGCIYFCFLHLTHLIKAVKSGVTRQPWIIWLGETVLPLSRAALVCFFASFVCAATEGGRTARLAEATSCRVSARTLQVKPVWRHSVRLPPPGRVFLLAVLVILPSQSRQVASAALSSHHGLLALIFLGPQREAEASTQTQRQALLLLIQDGVRIRRFAQAFAFHLPTNHPATNTRTRGLGSFGGPRGARRRCSAGGLNRRTSLYWTLTAPWDRQDQRRAGRWGQQNVPLWGEGRPGWPGLKGDGRFYAVVNGQTRRLPGEQLHRRDVARPDQERPAAGQAPHTGTRLGDGRTVCIILPPAWYLRALEVLTGIFSSFSPVPLCWRSIKPCCWRARNLVGSFKKCGGRWSCLGRGASSSKLRWTSCRRSRRARDGASTGRGYVCVWTGAARFLYPFINANVCSRWQRRCCRFCGCWALWRTQNGACPNPLMGRTGWTSPWPSCRTWPANWQWVTPPR